MAKRKRPQNVVAFPESRIVRKVKGSARVPPVPAPAPTQELDAQSDKLAELIAERAKRVIQKWQAAEGMPDEITMLVDRITAIANCPDGLPAVEVARLYECLPPREKATQGLSSAELRLLDQVTGASTDPNSAFSRALALRQQKHTEVLQ